MYTGIGTMRNKVTYRHEQNVCDNYGFRYSKKTGNIFTEDTTYSDRKGKEWIAQGYKVWLVRESDNQVIKMWNC